MKTKQVLAAGLLALCAVNTAKAQSTSYNSNSVPVSGINNVSLGNALNNSGTGNSNVVTGNNAMVNNTSGSYNVVSGTNALNKNMTGSDNVVLGDHALPVGDADRNTVVGASAMFNSTSGYGNAVLGANGLYGNTSDFYNIAVGIDAMYTNKNGNNCVAVGRDALYNSNNGSHQAAVGVNAMMNTTDGWYNSAMGADALLTNVVGYYNTALGGLADISTAGLSNATAVGSNAIVNANDRVWLGDANVVNGNVWSYGTYNTMSDGRFKNNISENDVKGLEFIKLLRPVVYNFDSRKATEFMTKNMSEEARKAHLQSDFSKAGQVRQSGFIAQEMAEAAKKAGYNFNGVHTPANDNDTYGIAYAQLVVPLVKAVQEQQQIIEQQQKRIEALEKAGTASTAADKAGLSTGISQSMADNAVYMEQNIPNPFNGDTQVKYQLPATASNAVMAVYDLSGKQIASFPIKDNSGTLTISSEKLAAGIYIYSIIANGKVLDSKRMVVTEK